MSLLQSEVIQVLKARRRVQFSNVQMLSEELRIRGELEDDIEMELEEEIKDGICHLALRLHQLYQYRKKRNNSSGSSTSSVGLFTEVKITIGMEDGCKVEISESKKDALSKTKSENSQLKVKRKRVTCSNKEFDWVRSLRVSCTRDQISPHALKNENYIHGNVEHTRSK